MIVWPADNLSLYGQLTLLLSSNNCINYNLTNFQWLRNDKHFFYVSEKLSLLHPPTEWQLTCMILHTTHWSFWQEIRPENLPLPCSLNPLYNMNITPINFQKTMSQIRCIKNHIWTIDYKHVQNWIIQVRQNYSLTFQWNGLLIRNFNEKFVFLISISTTFSRILIINQMGINSFPTCIRFWSQMFQVQNKQI